MGESEIEIIKSQLTGLRCLAEMVVQRCLAIEQKLPSVSTDGSKKTKQQEAEDFKNDPRFIKMLERTQRRRHQKTKKI